MSNNFTLLCILVFIGSYSVTGQVSSTTNHTPSYHELKEAGLLGNYTLQQLGEMQAGEAQPMQTRIDEMNSTRSIQPPLPTIESTSNAFSITPVNPSVCSGQSVTLGASNSFTSSSTGLYVADDQWSAIIPLPFSFTFYGITYNNCIISTNGSIGFNTANANFGSSWSIGNNQPTTIPNDLKNTISGPWEDLYIPSGGTMKYSTVGTAPNRIFVVEYCNVAYFGCGNSVQFTGQIQLFEGTNLIETHIYNHPICPSWNSARAVHSVQNAAGSIASVVAGRNATNAGWVTANEGTRWTWDNISLNYVITTVPFAPVAFFNPTPLTWYDASNSVLTIGPTYTTSSALPAGQYVYHAQISASWCGGTISYVAYDTVTVNNNLTAPTASSVTICPNTSTSLSGSCGGNCIWYNSSMVQVGVGFYTTPTLSSTTTYYVGYSSGACNSPTTAVTVTVGATLATPAATATSVCNSTTPSTLTGNCGANCQWYTDTTGTPVGTGATINTNGSNLTYYVQTFSGGCSSHFSAVTVPVGNLNVTATSNCAPGNFSTAYTGAYSTNVTQSNVTSSTVIANQTSSNYCTTSDPSDAVNCPASAYKTRTLLTPVGVTNPMTASSIVSVYFKLSDVTLSNYLGQPTAVGADPKVWLKSPQGTYLLLTSPRPFNTGYATSTDNYCYCPTFTPLGSSGVLPNVDGPYNDVNYTPEGGALGLAFNGQDPYSTNSGPAGTWTLYVNDNVDVGGLSSGALRIREFKITFSTYPTATYSWSLPGGCGTLSNTTIANPTYSPPSPPYNCTYIVTVTSGTCTGTSTINCVTLPIDLLSYAGKNSINGNELNWTTATEINNSYFTIERYREGESEAGAHWKIPSRAFDGNSTSSINYNLTDKDVKPGVYYYHLSQTDIDGTTNFHGTVAITVKPATDVINVVPNPTKGTADITYDCNSNETAFLKLYDHSGSLVMTREISCAKGENKYSIDLSGNPDGIYLITIATSDNVYKARVVKSQ